MPFPVNRNTNIEKGTKANTPHILRYVLHFNFKDYILGERLYSATEGSLKSLRRNHQGCLIGSFFIDCCCILGGIAVKSKSIFVYILSIIFQIEHATGDFCQECALLNVQNGQPAVSVLCCGEEACGGTPV